MKISCRFIAVIFCLGSVSLKAQILKDIKWGFSGSISNTNFNNIRPFSRYSTTGFKSGIFANRQLNSQYELLLALNVSRYGGVSYLSTRIIVPQANYDSTLHTVDKYLFTYLNLYPQVRYYPSVSGKIKLFMGFGLLAGYLLKATGYQYTDKGDLYHSSNERFAFYKVNFGVNIDVGIKMLIGNEPVWLSISYEPGLTNNGKGWRYNTDIKGFRTHALSLNLFAQLATNFIRHPKK